MKERTFRATVSAWIKEQIEGQTEVDGPALADAALARFRDDAEFMQWAIFAAIRPTLYEITTATMAATRTKLRVIEIGENKTKIQKEQAEKRSRWREWLENVGPNRSVSLWTMTRVDLYAAANQREQRATTEMAIAHFFRILAGRLPDDTAQVGQRLTEEQVTTIFNTVVGDQQSAAAAD